MAQKTLDQKIKSTLKNWPKPTTDRLQLITNYMSKNAPTQFTFQCLRIPVVRQSFKDLKINEHTLIEQQKAFDDLWKNSKIFEASLLSLYWLETLKLEQLQQVHKTIIQWSSKIDNWAHADQYCSTLAKMYEWKPELLEPTYRKWQKSKTPWLERLSMIGLVCYAYHRDKHPSYKRMIDPVEQFLHHDHYYVQKAIGWTMREIYNIYPDTALEFIFKNAADFHPAAWYAVTEKLSAADKKKALALRKLKTLKKSSTRKSLPKKTKPLKK